MRCLIVDDSATARALLRGLLKQAAPDAALVEADDATAAVQAYGREPFDLVFLDMRMGGENGCDVLYRLRLLDAAVRVVLVTGLPFTHPDVRAAMHAGTFGEIAKPPDAGGLRRVLSAAAATPR